MTYGLRTLDQWGLHKLMGVHWNLPPALLYEHALRRNEGRLTADGALAVRTGIHTGRSPNDKFVVEDAETKNTVWWGKVNQPFKPEAFDALLDRITHFLEGAELYVQDLAVGADPAYRLPIRVITQTAWHALFAQNMFLRPQPTERIAQNPAFTVLHVPSFSAIPERDGTRSGTFVIVNFTKKLVLIGGTSYAGEIKKAMFTIMNYLLPAKGVLPMHCSANIGPEGDTALFFGLSGTGKTTLSADGSRTLIGDDEHGWSGHGVFNFEGGCYAKAIRLSPVAEPEITAATRRFGTVLENVVMDLHSRAVDFDDNRYAENTRACYPIDYIPNASESGTGGIPQTIIMLTADAFGVLPPIAKLTPEQAMYHFLSGYTARVAGTEKGVTEPQATFSACFGSPFLPRPPEVYAKMLGEKIAQSGASCWLVNTGWSGGAYGKGSRMPIAATRALVRSALSGELAKARFVTEPCFGLAIPEACAGVDSKLLNPAAAWGDARAYTEAAQRVAALFAKNFVQFEGGVSADVRKAAIKAAA